MKLGLVLEGGASRTVYSCGVLDALLEEKIMADYVIGTSAGISYGVSYCSGQFGRNRDITEKYMNDKRYMGTSHLLRKDNKSYYNLNFVFGDIPNIHIPFDYNAYMAYNGNVIAAVTNIETGCAEYLELPRDDKNFIGLRASCALPLLFEPIEIDGKKYLDGGVSDSIPIKKALDDGCDKLIVVLTRPRGYVKTRESVMGLMKLKYRKYPELCRAIENRHIKYNKCIENLEQLERNGKAYVIRPSDTHEIKRTEKKPDILLPFYEEGLSDTRKLMPEIKEYITTK